MPISSANSPGRRQEPQGPQVVGRTGGELPLIQRMVVQQELEILRGDDRREDPAPPGDNDAFPAESGSIQRIREMVAEFNAVDAGHVRCSQLGNGGG